MPDDVETDQEPCGKGDQGGTNQISPGVIFVLRVNQS